MKLSYWLNGKALFTTQGDVPLVGQTIYAQDFSTTPPGPKKKYTVNSIDRFIYVNKMDVSGIKVETKDADQKINELIDITSHRFECYVTEINWPYLKYSIDEAQVHLVPWSMTVVDNSK